VSIIDKKTKKKGEDETPMMAPDPLPPKAAPAPPAPPAPAVKKYKVLKGGRFIWAGCIATLDVGAELDESGYGANGIEQIKSAGIELELLK